jgi:hypothetical protein
MFFSIAPVILVKSIIATRSHHRVYVLRSRPSAGRSGFSSTSATCDAASALKCSGEVRIKCLTSAAKAHHSAARQPEPTNSPRRAGPAALPTQQRLASTFAGNHRCNRLSGRLNACPTSDDEHSSTDDKARNATAITVFCGTAGKRAGTGLPPHAAATHSGAVAPFLRSFAATRNRSGMSIRPSLRRNITPIFSIAAYRSRSWVILEG